MAYIITDACVSCGACADQCPVSAIVEGDGKYEIVADVCVSCGCYVPEGRMICAECFEQLGLTELQQIDGKKTRISENKIDSREDSKK